ncbi:MAG: molybdopterin-dependent oxidoreductase [Burkholderiales bacterium]
MAVATLPAMSAALQTKALLTVSGRIGRVNNDTTKTYDFTESAFLNLTQSSITTGTSWTPTSVFVGPFLLDVMQTAGVTSGTLVVKALDGYSAPIPWEDLVRYGVILAHSQDGKRLSNKRWGPLWTMYPRDQNPVALKGPIAESRFIWQVNRIEVIG